MEKNETCYDCVESLIPAKFPGYPEYTTPFGTFPAHAGYTAGEVVNGQVWVMCPHGHCGGWQGAKASAPSQNKGSPAQ